jgi:hypothetical protein
MGPGRGGAYATAEKAALATSSVARVSSSRLERKRPMRRLVLAVVLAVALLCLPAAPALAATTITVRPSGGDDTAAIQAAFDAAVQAGPGSTVQLTAGHFYTNDILVQNFRGYFKGAGTCRTVIDCRRGNPAYADAPGVALRPDVEPFAFLIGFQGGNVSVSAMSFDITAYDPAQPYFDGFDRTSLGSLILVTGNASSAFDRVSFTAHEGDMGGPLPGELDGLNVGGLIDIMGKGLKDFDSEDNWIWLSLEPTGGVHSVTRCHFAGLAGVETLGLTGGRLVVGGCAAKQNVFDQYWECCPLIDISNSYVEISHNRMTAKSGGLGVFALQGWAAGWGGGAPLPPLPAPRYVIRDNDMLLSDGSSGVWLGDLSHDLDAPGRLKAVIAGNTIVLGEGCVGIGEYCTKNIKVLGNCFSSCPETSAMAGIYLGDNAVDDPPTLFCPVSGWMIVGNDLRNLTASQAPIVLGEGSTHCVVVCPWRTDVLDKGDHNILVNAHRL